MKETKWEVLEEPIKTLRIIVLGNSMVGKTSLIVRYADDTFNFDFAPTLGTVLSRIRV